MKTIKEKNIETQLIHAGAQSDQFGAVITPIYQTSTFRFKNVEQGAKLFAGKEKGFVYTRISNPTIEAMENCVAILERGHKALGCASGMAAVSTVFIALLQQNDHVICSDAVYGSTNILLKNFFSKFGVKTTFLDTSNTQNVADAINENTKIIYIESPTNPTLSISDIPAISKIAKEKNILVVVDNTFMGPILQTPLELGADIVLHSMTKSLNGHADVVAGIIVVKDEEMYKKIKSTLNIFGGVIDPFNSFLVNRGIKTLKLRVQQACDNALKVARFLQTHPQIECVKYPGLPSHPQYAIVKRDMRGFGAMISFELKGGIKSGEILLNNVELCTLAVSLGGIETLIQHPASMTHAGMSKEDRLNSGITDGLVRLSVGIENVDEIIEDLQQALEKCSVIIPQKNKTDERGL